jgi:DNA (cytosine-5)-methyltransferase 1
VSFDFVDLFAGIGGFHAVMTALGGNGVLAAEIDDAPAAVYESNWGLSPAKDVVELSASPRRLVPAHAVLAGGFPCQPFSKSGYQRGMSEQRGQLFHEVLKILHARRPPFVVLENVRNIAGPRQQAVWSSVVSGLRDEGYRVASQPCVFSPHLLPPHLGGAPQVRDRVYIVGVRVGRARAQRETDVLPAVTRHPVAGWNPAHWDLDRDVLLADHEIPHVGRYRLTAEEREWLGVWNDLLKRLGAVPIPGHPLWSEYWHDDAVVDPTAPGWKQVYEQKNIDFYQLHRRHVRAWLRANPALRTFPRSRQKLEWQAQDSVRDLRTCLIHLRPSGIRVKKPTYAPALVAMAQTPVLGPRDRRMAPREAARLQGFPDWFSFGEQKDKLTYKQLGNAINVGAAYHVVREHVHRDAEDLSRTDVGAALVAAVLAAPVAPLVPRPRLDVAEAV